MNTIDKRGEWVAGLGAGVSLAGAVLLGLLGMWSEGVAPSLWAIAFQVFAAVGIWLLVLIQLHQQRMVAEEQLEVSELERQRQEKLGGVQTIFEEDELDQMEGLAMGRRLRAIEKFLVPVVAIGVSVFNFLIGCLLLVPFIASSMAESNAEFLRTFGKWLGGVHNRFFPVDSSTILVSGDAAERLKILIFVMFAVSFVSFMTSRYALGLSRQPKWSLLRAGGNVMFGVSAMSLLAGIALLCFFSDIRWVETATVTLVGGLMVLLAIETVSNYILDFYRPRVAGQTPRPFYDSRFLGMFSEPGGILRSMANAIDYQFGFKVSETWFYKLLGRYVPFLLLLQALVIFGLTSILVVPPGHQAVVAHWGKAMPATCRPGIHFLAPWPIDVATVIPVKRIQRMELGHEAETETSQSSAILWTTKHYKDEYLLLVADRDASATAKVPVNLLSVDMPLQWRIRDDDESVLRYHAQAADVESILQSIAYREVTRYAAGADIRDLLGEAGITTARELHERIQAACDTAGYDGKGLGVEIIYLGIGGVHPPPNDNVAQSYEDVVSAEESAHAAVQEARGDAIKRKISSGGEVWSELYEAIVAEDKSVDGNLPDRAERTAAVEDILRAVAGGEARKTVALAEHTSYSRVFDGRSSAERNAQQVAAYEAAPDVYLLRVYLRMLQRGMVSKKSYVVALEDMKRVIFEANLKSQTALDTLGAELAATDSKMIQENK